MLEQSRNEPLTGPIRPYNKLGPGLLESVGWTIGYLLIQLGVALCLAAILILFAFEGWPSSFDQVVEILVQMDSANLAWLSVYLSGGATLVALFVIVPAACLRLRPQPRASLGTHRPSDRQLVLLAGAVLPLAILSDELRRAALLTWEMLQLQLAQFWPGIMHLAQQDTIDIIETQAAYTAYPLLLVIVGVGPAIGEELIFRGLIGRGLIQRYGVITGVAATSLLFAVAHGTPAHAVATIPLALFLHLTYLATRTIWAPILVHFLNNALSITMIKFSLGQNVAVSLPMLLSAAVYVTAIATLLWWTRSGQRSFVTVSSYSPPRDARGEVIGLVCPSWLTVLATTGVLGFTWTFVAAAVAG